MMIDVDVFGGGGIGTLEMTGEIDIPSAGLTIPFPDGAVFGTNFDSVMMYGGADTELSYGVVAVAVYYNGSKAVDIGVWSTASDTSHITINSAQQTISFGLRNSAYAGRYKYKLYKANV